MPTSFPAEATPESLADLVYRPRLASPGWSAAHPLKATGWSFAIYGGIGLAAALLGTAPRTPTFVPPTFTGTVTLVEAASPVREPSRSVRANPSAETKVVPPVEARTIARPPAFDTPASWPTLVQALAPAPVASSPSAPAGIAPGASPASSPRFDAAYLNNPDPTYPLASRRIGEEGRVILRVLVSAVGRAEQVEIRTSSGSPRLDEAALAAVKRWRFEPARRGQDAIQAWVLVPISFHLDA